MTSAKTILITGVSSGFGRALAQEALATGHRVIGTVRSREAQHDFEALHSQRAFGRLLDITDFEHIDEVVAEIESTVGPVDVLVNNAGITKDGLLMGMSEEDFDQVIDVNLKGTFNMMRFVSRQMLRQRSGRMISMASVVGIAGNAGQANYAASKAGIIGMTKSAARELASRGVTVNAVAPGFIETEMTAVLSEEVKKASAAQIPLGHFGRPEDIAKAVAFLASDDAAYITGQIIQVDGGMVI